MHTKKLHIYFLTWFVSILLATSGLAQGLDICKGTCCEKAQKAKQNVSFTQNPLREIHHDVGSPLCSSHINDIDTIGLPAPEKNKNEALPVCCHLKKAGQRAQGITTNSWSPDRSIVVLYTVSSACDFMLENRNTVIADCTFRSRGAPVPLYLINVSFIC